MSAITCSNIIDESLEMVKMTFPDLMLGRHIPTPPPFIALESPPFTTPQIPIPLPIQLHLEMPSHATPTHINGMRVLIPPPFQSSQSGQFGNAHLPTPPPFVLITSPELLAIHVPTPPPFFTIGSEVCEQANAFTGPSSMSAALPQQLALEWIPNQSNV